MLINKLITFFTYFSLPYHYHYISENKMNIYVVKVVHPKIERVDCQIRISITYAWVGEGNERRLCVGSFLPSLPHNDAFVILGEH